MKEKIMPEDQSGNTSKMHIKDRVKDWLNKEIDLGEFFIVWWIVIWSAFFLILSAL